MTTILAILLAVTAFPLNEVKLLDSRWRDNMERDSAWVCSITSRQALHNFRTTVGLYSAKEGGYDTMQKMGGWESPDCDLRGHVVGHMLSAHAFLYAATSDPIFLCKADSIVQGIRECQRYIGTGYVSAFPEGLIDRNIKGQSVWAPWYTLHKLMAGMLNQYHYCKNDTALQVVRDFAGWAEKKLLHLDAKTRRKILSNEFGGMPEVWMDLFLYTGDSIALQLADFFCDDSKLDPLYKGQFDMGTMHTNTFLPKVIAEAKRAKWNNQPKYRDMPKAFLDEMLKHHVMAPGIVSDKEHFFPKGTMSKHLTAYTGESCCTYNMLRLANMVYSVNPKVEYIQYIEQALVNDVLGRQETQHGMINYFLPMQTGAYKLYSTPMNSFWCCVGTNFEAHAKYGENIYWHTNDTIMVNLWVPSILTCPSKGLVLRQETDFPNANTTTICVLEAPKKKITLMVRMDSTYHTISRQLRKGERITITREMKLHTVPTPDNPDKAALFYGPVLLAGKLGKVEKPFSNPDVHNDYYTYDYQVPDSIKEIVLNIDSLVHQENTTNKFITHEGIQIVPLYDVHYERYVVYWHLKK